MDTLHFKIINGGHLDDEHEYEDENEGGVEVGDVECGAEAPDQRVAANHAGQQHSGHLGAQARHKAGEQI